VRILAVTPGSAAQQVGLQPGWQVHSINGAVPDSREAAIAELKRAVGEVKLAIIATPPPAAGWSHLEPPPSGARFTFSCRAVIAAVCVVLVAILVPLYMMRRPGKRPGQ
jgi:membrane-associated protease RseP (regulator of RpoE activity)